MTETTTAAAWGAYLSAATLALFGVNYYALLGAFGGVLATLSSVQPTGPLRAFLLVTINTFAAGIAGQGTASLLGIDAKPAVMLLSLLWGAGLHVLLEAAVDALVTRVRAWGAK